MRECYQESGIIEAFHKTAAALSEKIAHDAYYSEAFELYERKLRLDWELKSLTRRPIHKLGPKEIFTETMYRLRSSEENLLQETKEKRKVAAFSSAYHDIAVTFNQFGFFRSIDNPVTVREVRDVDQMRNYLLDEIRETIGAI